MEEIEAIPFDPDKALFLDLLRLCVDKTNFTPTLLKHMGDQSLSEFRSLCQLAAQLTEEIRDAAKSDFHKNNFQLWREGHFKEFMREKRHIERVKGRYAKPYVDYLDVEERRQFAEHWQQNRYDYLYKAIFSENRSPELKALLRPLSKSDRHAYLKALRIFDDLTKPLHTKYPLLRSEEGVNLEKHLASAFYPYMGFGTGRSAAFRQASPMGSIFKVIPAYAGLLQKQREGAHDINPLTIIDDMQWTNRPGSNAQVLGYLENGEPIKRFYKGGRLPRAYPKIGKIDVVKALERSSNIYFSILAGDVLKSPSSLMNAAISFGIGMPTGIDLPGEYKGMLPDDIVHNKTGLYSFAMGQHSLVVTPLQAASMFCAIANKGELLKPQIVKLSAGFDADKEGYISFQEPIVRDKIDMPEAVQAKLLEGMHQATSGDRGSARPAIIRKPFHDKEALASYNKLHTQMAGKTGTAEILYKQTIDAESRAQVEKHVWFGAISYIDDEPELVIVVYSRFGAAGRQGAPIAAKIIDKWREIKQRHSVY